jgi:hypothetical protein
MRLLSPLPREKLVDADRTIAVSDEILAHGLKLVRSIDIPAGRIQPGAEYARFRRFVADADAVLDREVVVGK